MPQIESKTHGHEIEDEDLDFEKRWFTFERIAWVLLGLLITGACLGALGPGMISNRVAEREGLRVHYSALIRAKSAHDFHVRASSVTGKELHLRVTGDLAAATRPSMSSPQPSSETAADDAIVYTYTVQPGTPAEITLTQRPGKPGRSTGAISIEGGSSVTLSQIVLP